MELAVSVETDWFQKHADLNELVDYLQGFSVLTSEQQLELKQLKKERLFAKDMMHEN
jgi:uncharacterized protein YdcH (DUF465 family)